MRQRYLRGMAMVAASLVLGLGYAPQSSWGVVAAPTIDTVAGGGEFDGLVATLINVNPYGVAIDRYGRLYVSEQSTHRVLRIDPESEIVTTIAGNGTKGSVGDGGPATLAGLSFPAGIGVDSQFNVYIADSGNHRVRKVSPDGVIVTFAGSSSPGLSGDGGPADQAQLNSPEDIAIDANDNVYIADSGNNRIRRVDVARGTITTVAGSSQGYAGDGGPATSAKLGLPFGIGFDQLGRLLIADSLNNRIRRVDLNQSTPTITTIAGTSSSFFNGDGLPPLSTNFAFPMDVGVDGQGNVLVLDSNHSRLRRLLGGDIVDTIAGGKIPGFSGDGGPASGSLLNAPSTVATDSNGRIFIADTANRRVRRIASDLSLIETVAGNGNLNGGGDGLPAPAAILSKPIYSTDDGFGGFYFVENNAHKVRHVDGATQILTTVAGTGSFGFGGDGGPAVDALLSSPNAICRDSAGNLYVTDSGNNRIRKIFAGTSGLVTPDSVIQTVAGGGTQLGDGGPATQAQLSFPAAAAVDTAGNLYIADAANNRIRRVDTRGTITTLVGSGTWGFAGDNGPGLLAKLALPWDVALDGRGSLYIADLQNNRVRKYDLNNDVVTTLAGNGIRTFAGDGGPATLASLSSPTGVAVDPDGNVYIADSGNIRVRRVDALTGYIYTVAGNGARTGWIDGPGGNPADDLNDGQSPLLASFLNPGNVTIQQNSFLISDPDLGRVRRVEPLPSSDGSPVPTPTPPATPSATLTATATRTAVPTSSPTSVPTRTATQVPTSTSAPTRTATSTHTPILTATRTPTKTKIPPTSTAVPTHTATPIPTHTPIPTFTGTPTHTLPPTFTPTTAPTWTPPLGSLADIALGKSATQSSTAYGSEASRGIDGLTDGVWGDGSVTHTSFDVQAWWQVDLGSVQPIYTIDVWPRTDCCADRLNAFYVLVSDTPFTSTDLTTVLSQPGVSSYFTPGTVGAPTEISVSRTGRYVRVQLTDTNYLSVAEVQVWGGSGLPTATATPTTTQRATATPTNPQPATLTPTQQAAATATLTNVPAATSTPSGGGGGGGTGDLALGMPATQSSTAYGGTASRAADGNTDGNFSLGSVTHTNLDTHAWWQVDLQANQSIDRIDVWTRTDCCTSRLSNFYIFVSDNPFSSQDLNATLSQTGVSSYFVSGTAGRPTSVTIGRTGRYVRIQLSTSDYLSLAEVQVWGASNDPPPAASPTRTNTIVPTATKTTGTAPTPTTTPSGGGSIDLALGRPVSQSSTAFGAPPERAVDGNTSGNWNDTSLSHTDNDSQAWWEVDLGSVQNIGEVDLWNRTDCCGSRLSDFYVLVSDDPFTSTSLSTTLTQPGVSEYFTAGAAGETTSIGVNRTGRYVRVQLSGMNYLALAEVQVWSADSATPPPTPTPGSNTDLALHQLATQCSTFSGGTADRAVDGMTFGSFSGGSVTHTDQDFQAWWQVDLGSVQPIGKIDIWPRTDCCTERTSAFYVLVSNVPFTSTDLNTTINQLGVDSYYTSGTAGTPTTIAANRMGRYVRVQLSGTNYLSIAEVQVWHQ